MKVRLSLTGTTTLLLHNVRLADPLDPIAKAMKSVSNKRKKTEDDHLQLARLEFEGGMYFAPDIGPYVPGANLEKCLVEGARITKQGKQVERGLFIIDNELPLLYEGPRTIEELWANINFRSRMAVRVGQSVVMRTRPQFRTWALEAEAQIDPGLLDLDTLRSISNDAGVMVGLTDYRPRYGRFQVEVNEL